MLFLVQEELEEGGRVKAGVRGRDRGTRDEGRDTRGKEGWAVTCQK
jgi:hypothetical protein